MPETNRQLIDTLLGTINDSLSNLHTCTIAKVTKVNGTTIDCKPVFKRLVDGQEIDLPEFIEVPVLVNQGGGSYVHFPISVGDYAVLFFTERCFDGWWNGQDDQLPLEYRMHDYSDGLAFVDIGNVNTSFEIPSVIQRTGDVNQDGDVVHTGDKEQTGLYTLIGNMVMQGDGGAGSANYTNVNIIITTGDITADGVSLKNHTHDVQNVQTGSSTVTSEVPN